MRTPPVTAVLGPTNTGKTHYAIERMLAHRTGVIGLPLRLLAREVYDRIVAIRGPSVVALITGEERIVPDRVQYWVCTTEAMPEGMATDFLAVDEIQLCADPERGHVFTDRLLRSRGLHETLFLGSETMRSAIAALVPGAQFMHRERFSVLSYTGGKKLTRIPARSAIVCFSSDEVYAIAELIRRTKGGAAVVMGALSPRTRNAQVELYQNGDVEYLVATDAIGMGLNLDIDHVAFAALEKFDGRNVRRLQSDELAQIAGRAGRHMNAGTFGVTAEAGAIDPEDVAAIENHQFRPVTRLQWRNARLEFGTLPRLIQSLEKKTDDRWLGRVREADDLMALKTLAADAEVYARASSAPAVRLLWDVCRIPDFRGISHGEHAGLLREIYNFLHQHGHIPQDWFAQQVARTDRPEGDIDTLSRRLAFIRTWTYVAQRRGWLREESHWREATRAVEDRLSDALHGALTQRFVDRRTSVLLRRLKMKEGLVADVNDKGEVTVDGEFVGRLQGFRFIIDKAATPDEARTIRQAAYEALKPHFNLRADRIRNALDPEFDLTEQGGLMWGDASVGKLVAGADPLKPQVEVFVDEEAGADVLAKVQWRLQYYVERKIATAFEPLLLLRDDAALTGMAKGFAYRLVETFGVMNRAAVAEEVKALDQEARGQLRKHRVRFGQFSVYLPLLLKPAPTRLRLLLWSLKQNLDEFPTPPPPGLVTVPAPEGASAEAVTMMGFRAAGDRAIRLDMLESLADMLRGKDSKAGFEASADMLSITGMTLEQFAALMEGLGYRAEKAERVKARPEEAAAAQGDMQGDMPEPGPLEIPMQPDETQPPELPEDQPEDEPEAEPDMPETPDAPEAKADAAPAEGETEVFYTFTWAPRRRHEPRHEARGEKSERGGQRRGGKGRGQAREGQGDAQPREARGEGGKGRGKGDQRGKGKARDDRQPKRDQAEARPQREKRIDPDNPFAMALSRFKVK